MTRREIVAAFLAAGIAPAALPRRGAADVAALQSCAAQNGRFFGSAVRLSDLDAESDFRSAVLANCGVLVPELALKWAAIEPDPAVLDFADPDALIGFAKERGKTVRGHTLLWHESVPAWADSALRETRDWTIVARYFGSVMPRYGDVIHQWDVVNEPIETGHRMDGLRENVFLDAFGPGYIARALSEARTFAPAGQLMLNEYGLEYDLPVERDRRLPALETARTSQERRRSARRARVAVASRPSKRQGFSGGDRGVPR